MVDSNDESFSFSCSARFQSRHRDAHRVIELSTRHNVIAFLRLSLLTMGRPPMEISPTVAIEFSPEGGIISQVSPLLWRMPAQNQPNISETVLSIEMILFDAFREIGEDHSGLRTSSTSILLDLHSSRWAHTTMQERCTRIEKCCSGQPVSPIVRSFPLSQHVSSQCRSFTACLSGHTQSAWCLFEVWDRSRLYWFHSRSLSLRQRRYLCFSAWTGRVKTAEIWCTRGNCDERCLSQHP